MTGVVQHYTKRLVYGVLSKHLTISALVVFTDVAVIILGKMLLACACVCSDVIYHGISAH